MRQHAGGLNRDVAATPAIAPLPTAVLTGFDREYAALLASHLQASRKLRLISGLLPWENAMAALDIHKPAVALISGEAADLVTVAKLARRHPETGFIVLARRLTEARARAFEECGMAATLPRDMDRWLLVLLTIAVARGVRGGVYLSSSLAPDPNEGRPWRARLSPREALLLEFLVEHQPLAEIADGIGVGTSTVKSQTKSIYRKLGVYSRQELRRVVNQEPLEHREPYLDHATRDRVPFAGYRSVRPQPSWVRRPVLTIVR